MIEQDHLRIKQRTKAMLGFKTVRSCRGDDQRHLAVQKIQKHQFKTGQLGGRSATMLELWIAVLAARP